MNDMAQDYHDMMIKIFDEMKVVRKSGDVELTMDFDNNKEHL